MLPDKCKLVHWYYHTSFVARYFQNNLNPLSSSIQQELKPLPGINAVKLRSLPTEGTPAPPGSRCLTVWCFKNSNLAHASCFRNLNPFITRCSTVVLDFPVDFCVLNSSKSWIKQICFDYQFKTFSAEDFVRILHDIKKRGPAQILADFARIHNCKRTDEELTKLSFPLIINTVKKTPITNCCAEKTILLLKNAVRKKKLKAAANGKNIDPVKVLKEAVNELSNPAV